MIAGIRLFGLIFRKSGANCSFFEMLTGCTLYGTPISSSATLILRPLGVFQVNSSIGMIRPFGMFDLNSDHSQNAGAREPLHGVTRREDRHLERQLYPPA